ncbi:MAG: glucan biosynthesis protein [Marinibacterium sp.]
MTLHRRNVLGGILALAAAGPVRATGAGMAFDAQSVIDLARDLAARRYRPRAQVPADWLDMTYEQYRTMWFRHDRALWHDEDRAYEVDFFHPGLYFPRPIRVFTVEDGMARPVPFDLSRFDRTDKAPDLTVDETLGYSGLRLRTDLNGSGNKSEFCVFQGASYFRAIGAGETYGLSARGLALRTADRRGEEFPDFTDFWLESPQPGQHEIVLHALLDSPSVAGAYRFVITPGASCSMDVTATLFPRADLDHVGLGPLTSMFLFDAKDRTRFDDFRPRVHDSDGLLMHNGAGEALWRPLNNPRALQVSAFVDRAPRGFGLMQRPRALSDYNDLEANYHNRPGLWVEPAGDWGRGSVALVEIPADKEIYDNIVAYWRPSDPLAAGTRADFSYRLTWGAREPAPDGAGLARVLNTAMGKGWHGGKLAVIDFANHPMFDDGPEAMTVLVSSPHVDTTDGVLQRNPATGGLRLAFGFDPGDRTMVELRAQLRKDGRPASEVWLYRWTL